MRVTRAVLTRNSRLIACNAHLCYHTYSIISFLLQDAPADGKGPVQQRLQRWFAAPRPGGADAASPAPAAAEPAAIRATDPFLAAVGTATVRNTAVAPEAFSRFPGFPRLPSNCRRERVSTEAIPVAASPPAERQAPPAGPGTAKAPPPPGGRSPSCAIWGLCLEGTKGGPEEWGS